MAEYNAFPRRRNGCLLAFLCLFGVAVLAHMFDMPKDAVENASADKTDAPKSAWAYSQSQDKLRGTSNLFAEITSDNYETFDFSYVRTIDSSYSGRVYTSNAGNASVRLTMTLSRDHGGDDVYFTIEKGSFSCDSDGCTGAINIDGKQKPLTLTEARDDPRVLFVEGSGVLAPLIRDLQAARNIIVELPFFHQGRHQFSFSTPVTLNWPPKDSDYR